jgi:hypothetical protein
MGTSDFAPFGSPEFMLSRSLSVASQRLASNPIWAVDSLEPDLGQEGMGKLDNGE